MPYKRVFAEADADKSIGILNILWHSISFITRGNTKPLAMYRKNLSPLFAGRILALNGDFHDISIDVEENEFAELLNCEIASMYIPSDVSAKAVVKFRHMPDKEILLDQREAPREFILKVVEVICSGGTFHESDKDDG